LGPPQREAGRLAVESLGSARGGTSDPERRPTNARDPLFAAIFENADKIHVRSRTRRKDWESRRSDDPAVTALTQRHVEVVGMFIENGMHEMMRIHW